MGYELIITEKPSAALKIATALADSKFTKKNIKGAPYYILTHSGKDIVVGCAVGHLFTVTEKKKSFKYPVFDIEWKPTHLVSKGAKYSKKYLDVLAKIAKGATEFTVACDYDIEGEVIGLNCVRFICKQKDASRMKFSTLTKQDLLKSYEKKEPHIDWGQANAGDTRHRLDWMYGINLSRALTLAIRKNKGYKVLSSGRVQGPALKILVDREREIKAFEPVPFWQIQLLGVLKGTDVEAWHEKDKFWHEKDALSALSKAKGHDGKIVGVDKRKFKQLPPTPFDLTTLQTEAYRTIGSSPKQTLSIAQELYLAGLISYPRTSSQKLPESLGFKKIMGMLAKQPLYRDLANQLLLGKLKPNEGTKNDPAHPAIYPTGEIKALDGRKKKVYDLIVRRFMACFGDPAVRESVKLTIDVNSEKFHAKGTITVEKGWHIYYGPYLKLEEKSLPKVLDGNKVKTKKIIKHDKETQPPKRYTPASIIKELEKRGLGTKATRAAIIDALYNRDYVSEKSLHATELGIKTIGVLEKYCPEIVKDDLTRQFEEEMDLIREDKSTPKKVLDTAVKELNRILDDFKKKEALIGKDLSEAYRETMNEENHVGLCPKCKKGTLRVIHSKKTRQRYIACDAYPDCKTIYNIPQKGKIRSAEKNCPDCGTPMVRITTKKNQIVCINKACPSKQPKDSFMKKESKEMENGVVEEQCPKCEGGVLKIRKSVYGTFLGCSNFPKCRYTQRVPGEPLKEDFKKKNIQKKKTSKKKG